MATVTERLLSAEEFAQLPDDGVPTELVRGRIISMNVPVPRHGEICCNIAFLVLNHAREHNLGRVIVNDGGVITEHDPDTVRGPDVSFYSFARVPRGPLPHGYLDVVPELVFEVRSPTDRWSEMLARASEFLKAGITVVCLVDEASEAVHVFRADEQPRILRAADELTLPDILGNFRVAVQRFFE
jgi:Uma2 family endonuclease